KAMTRSAKGTVEEPGKNVKPKAGLNRGILNTGWGQLERNLDYKAGGVLKVDAAYTSQTCSSCGHISQGNRRTQATFKCVACGFKANADHNAALNILARGLALLPKARGNGASARREALGPCLLPLAMDKSTSPTREQGMPTAQGPPGSGAWSSM
ncbi:MAG: transposase, partial [Caldilineaceae bacterium SB0661_bin_34]|nr:transposase [Caldilineaceae bacterium SB0661_bin_34]